MATRRYSLRLSLDGGAPPTPPVTAHRPPVGDRVLSRGSSGTGASSSRRARYARRIRRHTRTYVQIFFFDFRLSGVPEAGACSHRSVTSVKLILGWFCAHVSNARCIVELIEWQRTIVMPNNSSLKAGISRSHSFGSHAQVIDCPRPRWSRLFSGELHIQPRERSALTVLATKFLRSSSSSAP